MLADDKDPDHIVQSRCVRMHNGLGFCFFFVISVAIPTAAVYIVYCLFLEPLVIPENKLMAFMLNPFSRLIKCCFANDLKCRKYFSTRLLLFQDITTLKALNKILADISLMFSNYFSEKIRLGISCELSARQMIYMKCQALYSSKIYEKKSEKKKK